MKNSMSFANSLKAVFLVAALVSLYVFRLEAANEREWYCVARDSNGHHGSASSPVKRQAMDQAVRNCNAASGQNSCTVRYCHRN